MTPSQPDTNVGVPPVLAPKPRFAHQMVAIVLSMCLWLFLADGVCSLADSSLVLFFNFPWLTGIREIAAIFAAFLAILVYVLIGITPMVPKRFFLPLTLFSPVAFLIAIPVAIYCFNRVQLLDWALSLIQVMLGLGILYLVQGSFKLRWMLIPDTQLETPDFSWWNLSAFLLANLFVVVPAFIFYLIFCIGLGMDHFTDGFLQLRPGGLTVTVRKYVREDGKTIQLYPMSHVADADFYHRISQAFPTNSMILMEGVTDEHNLLTNKISYKRMAHSLGLSEQRQEFNPVRGQVVMADLDVDQFTTNTLALLNMVMLIHTKGFSAGDLKGLFEYPVTPQLATELFDDLLTKRNRHLLEEIRTHLAQTDHIIIPWGLAHMPGISAAIQKQGFHLEETRKYVVIRFGSGGERSSSVGKSDPD